jgi:nucleotide-binding universal stress UspA family protein
LRLEALALGLPPAAAPELRLGRGDPADDLRRAADEENAELIVIGAPERGPIPTLVSGSVAGALASSAPVPVLVVSDGGWHEVGAGPLGGPATSAATPALR